MCAGWHVSTGIVQAGVPRSQNRLGEETRVTTPLPGCSLETGPGNLQRGSSYWRAVGGDQLCYQFCTISLQRWKFSAQGGGSVDVQLISVSRVSC